MLKKLFSLLIVIIAFGPSEIEAQEFNCKITIMHDKITGVDNQVYLAMEKSLTEFINTKRWTNDEFGTSERIDCNIQLNLTANNVGGDIETYSANFSMQATRPVYNSTYNSTLINYVDKDLTFKFSPFTPIHFDDNQVSGSDAVTANLPAVIAYYCYIALGLDYDSFAPLGGTQYFKRAQGIVSNAPDGKGITGWKAVESTHNRYWVIDQMLNTRFEEVRRFWYSMHREGLDSMYAKPTESRNRILNSLKKIHQVSRENPSSIYLQFFFNAKSDEIIHVLSQAPKSDRPPFISILTAMDVANAPKYNQLK